MPSEVILILVAMPFVGVLAALVGYYLAEWVF